MSRIIFTFLKKNLGCALLGLGRSKELGIEGEPTQP